jgi:DNA mismatch repair protein MSH3
VLHVLMFTDRNFKAAGGPTHRGALYVRRLVEAGHKVGLVRQTETAALKAAGESRSKLFERRVCAVYTRATVAAAPAMDGAEPLGEALGSSSYLVAVVEAPATAVAADGGGAQMALVGVEASTGEVVVGTFRDGPLRSSLEGLLLVLQPGEVLLASPAAAPLSGASEKLVRGLCCGCASAARVERADTRPFENGGALAELTAFYARGGDGGGGDDVASHTQALLALPDLVHVALAVMLRHLRQFGLTAVLARAAGFKPLQEAGRMRLPPNALRQLAVLSAQPDGGGGADRGSLLWLMDRTASAGGKRTLRGWVAAPLCSRAAIEQRLDAVAALAAAGESAEDAACGGGGGGGGGAVGAALLSAVPGLFTSSPKLPDVDRALTRALHLTATPSEFCAALTALATRSERLAAAMHEAAAAASNGADGGEPPLPPLLQRLFDALTAPQLAATARALLSRLNPEAAAAQPPMLELLFVSSRDLPPPPPPQPGDAAIDDDAMQEDRLPPPLSFPEVEGARDAIAAAEAALEALLPSLRAALRAARPLEWTRVGDAHHLIELPADAPVPPGWLKHSTVNARRGGGKVTRWSPPPVRAAEEELERARERLLLASRAAWRSFLESFGSLYGPMRAAAAALAELDALASLAATSRLPGYVRPTFVCDGAPTQLRIADGRHPMLDALLNGAFIANDCALGGGAPRGLVVTGPNMGGKSSYIRACALVALMAHVGCYVPASSATLSVLDGIQARMGAADSLATGASTFLEEMTECSVRVTRARARARGRE